MFVHEKQMIVKKGHHIAMRHCSCCTYLRLHGPEAAVSCICRAASAAHL